MDADVVVVGAGLSGLRCAAALRGAGRDVVVLEASDAPGGRIRTDVVDGFRVDRGFQLLNPAYPAVRRWVDVDALEMQYFGAGVAARTDDGLVRLGNPLGAPGLLPATLAAAATRPREVAAVLRWARPLLTPRRGRPLRDVVAHTPDVDLRAALDGARVDGLLRTVVERFLSGVVLDDGLTTANRFVLLLAWTFARHVPGLPRHGMQALPQQLADRLGDGVRLETPAEALDRSPDGVIVTTAAGLLRARAVVVATGAAAAHELTGIDVPLPHGVVTTWWDAPTVPDSDLLHVDGRAVATGPVVNCAVVSRPAPSYAPGGRHLVQASALMGAPRPTPGEADLRHHAGELLGVATESWRVVARHEVPDALPAQPPPYAGGRTVALGDGVFVCGDHRDTASIQGALVSGQRAAEAVLATLR